jgi:hypothetical protein
MTDDVIYIVTDDPGQTLIPEGRRDGSATRNPFDDPRTIDRPDRRGIPVKVENLEVGVSEFLLLMGRVFRRAQQSAGEMGGMELDEIELSVEVNGEGQLSLLGSGAKVGSKGAMTLKFKAVKREPAKESA